MRYGSARLRDAARSLHPGESTAQIKAGSGRRSAARERFKGAGQVKMVERTRSASSHTVPVWHDMRESLATHLYSLFLPARQTDESTVPDYLSNIDESPRDET